MGAALWGFARVIANEVPPKVEQIAANVRVISLGKEAGASRIRRTATFERTVGRLTRGDDVLGLILVRWIQKDDVEQDVGIEQNV